MSEFPETPEIDIESIWQDAAPDSTEGAGESIANRANQVFFGILGEPLVEKGWSVFPQERDERRKPGNVRGEVIKWSEEYKMAEQLPDIATVRSWQRANLHLNVALVFGPAIGNVFALDIDITDPDMAAEVILIAEDILGPTRFKRIGQYPKMALLYRWGNGVGENIQRKFTNKDGDGASEHGIDVLAVGKPLTIYGLHHKTGHRFEWPDLHPLISTPDEVPEITLEAYRRFYAAVNARFPFWSGNGFDGQAHQIEYRKGADGEFNIPVFRNKGATDWVENDQGLVVDGREAYLSHLTFTTVTCNEPLTHTAEGRERLYAGVKENFSLTADTNNRRWRGNQLDTEIRGKVDHAIGRLHRGEIQPYYPSYDKSGRSHSRQTARSIVVPNNLAEDPDLGFLPSRGQKLSSLDVGRSPVPAVVVNPPNDERAETRRLIPDRTDIARNIADDIEKALNVFFDEVYAYNDEEEPTKPARVHILKAPTGGGKTSRTIRYIAADPRTKETVISAKEGCRNPILFLLPTYANIDELRLRADVLNLDPGLSDDELRAAAEEMGLIPQNASDARIADLQRDAIKAGLNVMTYKGKIAAGCRIPDKMGKLMDAGIGASNLCHAKWVKDGEPQEDWCKFYAVCPAIRQKAMIQQSHVVFLPHAFMHLQIPEELSQVRAVIADERIHSLFLHTTTMERSTISTPVPRSVKLTKKEKQENLTSEHFEQQRMYACRIADEAITLGEDIANYICELTKKGYDFSLSPAENQVISAGRKANDTDIACSRKQIVSFIESAQRACGVSFSQDIRPTMSDQDVNALCSRPTGKEVHEEGRLWKLVGERLGQIFGNDELLHEKIAAETARIGKEKNEEQREKLLKGIITPLVKQIQARGDRDYRIQALHEEDEETGEPLPTPTTIRLSWRSEPNWTGKPMLLLDASAEPRIIKKIFNGMDVVEHHVHAPLNVRIVAVIDSVFSNSSLIARPGDEKRFKVAACARLEKVRRAISLVSAQYGHTRVVAGANMIVRRAINSGWMSPENIDWCHYGAMRGLDFAKYHGAAFSIGRMEVPFRVIDGVVAALTYDDLVPERPYDETGVGFIESEVEVSPAPTEEGGATDPITQKTWTPLFLPKITTKLALRDGSDYDVEVDGFDESTHPWARAVQKQYREEEQSQFLGRLRPVYREGHAPVWFALSSILPEGVIIDDLITLDDMIGDSTSAHSNRQFIQVSHLWDAIRVCRGVAHPETLSALNFDLYPTPAMARFDMERMGFDCATGERHGRQTQGFDSWRYETKTSQGFIFIRRSEKDPVARIKATIREAIDEPVDQLSRVSSGSDNQGVATARTPDKIEHDLGPLLLRRRFELALMDLAAEAVSNMFAVEEVGKMIDKWAAMPMEKESHIQAQTSAGILKNEWRMLPARFDVQPTVNGQKQGSMKPVSIRAIAADASNTLVYRSLARKEPFWEAAQMGIRTHSLGTLAASSTPDSSLPDAIH